MANEIDLVVGSEAFAQITKLLVELGKVDTTFTELSAKFAALGSNTNTVKSTADLAKLTAENAKLNAVIEQQIKDFTDLNAKLAQATTARTSTTKAVTEATIAQRELNAQTTLNIKATTDAVGAYAKLDAQHKLAVKTAQDLAVATGRTGQAYEDAKNKANELGGKLRVIDTDIGKHTRNVGNYSSSWNGLGNSINQLTREAPAFANSVQTGFMALSNNIPILTDELGVLIQKNKDLQAEGKPTQSILKTVAGAFFSWQTAISLGVTILTVYGSKLVDMALGLGDVKRETDKLIASQAKLDKSVTDVTATILHKAQLQIDKAKLRNASQKEQDDILLNANKDVLKQLEIAENTSAEKKYQAAKKYRDAVANESGIVINQYSSREDKIRKQKEQADIAALAKLGKVNDEQFKILEQGHVKRKNATIKQGLLISELTSSQQVARHEEAKAIQDKLDKLADKPEKKVLKFDEVKSVHDLAEAKIEGQKIDLQSADLDKLTTEQKIENRTKLTEFELLKIFEVASEEKAIADKKRDDDKVENDRALKNKTIDREQYNKNIEDINQTHKNVLEKINVEELNKEKVLLNSQEKYIEDLRKKDIKSSQELSIKKLDAEILADKMIYEDKEKGKKQTLKDRKAAFQEFLLDAEKRIAIQEKMAMTEAGADPIKQEAVRENFKALRLELTKIISPAEQAKEAVDGFFRDSFDKSMNNSLEALGMSSLKTFLDFDKNGQSSFMRMMGNTDSLAEKSAIAFQVIGDAAQGMFNTINESSQASFDAEYARLDAQKNEAIKNAGDSAASKEKIEADYAAKKKEIQLREFKQKQKMSLANIAIDTAQAIVSIWAQVPKVDFGVSATALSIFVGALGAIQAGMVLAQKPPAYAEGTDNHSGGMMLVNDGKGANYEEKVVLPSGKVIRPQGRNVLMNAPKGTKVLNHEQQLFEMLQSNNISMSSPQNSGLTYEEMNEIFQNNFANIKTQNTIFDKNGFQSYVKNGNSITRSNSNRSQAIGISV